MRRLHLLEGYNNINRLDPNIIFGSFTSPPEYLLNMENIPEMHSVLTEEQLEALEAIMENALIESAPETAEEVVEDTTTTQEEIQEHEDIIPENSRTILLDEYTSRFNSAIWYDKIRTMRVILAGVGGIGSYIGFLLSRLQINRLVLYDPDVVESVNISGQMYPLSSIGEFKTEALAKILRDFSNFYGYSFMSNRFTSESGAGPIMICGFDNMEARKMFFLKWKSYVMACRKPQECLFIDGRLAAEEFQVLTIQGDDDRAIQEYETKWLFSDEEAEATVCSYKQTTFMANMIASVMVNAFVNFAANLSDPAPIIPRDIPFFISYSADTMFTKVEM